MLPSLLAVFRTDHTVSDPIVCPRLEHTCGPHPAHLLTFSPKLGPRGRLLELPLGFVAGYPLSHRVFLNTLSYTALSKQNEPRYVAERLGRLDGTQRI